MDEIRKKVKSKEHTPRGIVERNIALLEIVMRFLLAKPRVFDSLPKNFELVILPEDDPEIRLHNLELLDRYAQQGKTIVFARVRTSQVSANNVTQPSFYVPLAA